MLGECALDRRRRSRRTRQQVETGRRFDVADLKMNRRDSATEEYRGQRDEFSRQSEPQLGPSPKTEEPLLPNTLRYTMDARAENAARSWRNATPLKVERRDSRMTRARHRARLDRSSSLDLDHSRTIVERLEPCSPCCPLDVRDPPFAASGHRADRPSSHRVAAATSQQIRMKRDCSPVLSPCVTG